MPSSVLTVYLFLSTPSARRATLAQQTAAAPATISIHALREEGDIATPSAPPQGRYFYPRPPRGGRLVVAPLPPALEVFLSTPSARRATGRCGRVAGLHRDFYPRPPRGGRHNAIIGKMEAAKFLSTPSARRATPELGVGVCIYRISIHALREEGDGKASTTAASTADFYPRPPRGGRLDLHHLDPGSIHFYPRPPRGGRLGIPHHSCTSFPISIHALREEGDTDSAT